MQPKYHLCAPYGWLNDPNGLIVFQGHYHLFYQHFPYAPSWGTMHWGHAISDDLVHFTHLPIALYPSKAYDRNGCFSGSALVRDEELYLYYTGIRYTKEDPENIHIKVSEQDYLASQVLCRSKDGRHFDNLQDKQVVIPVINDLSQGHPTHTRDPKVWLDKSGQVFLAVGSKIPSTKGYAGAMLFYQSQDGVHFERAGIFSDPEIGDMWECPDLVNIEGQRYAMVSAENIDQVPGPNCNALIFPVAGEGLALRRTGAWQYLDEGLDFYAPQTFQDMEGNLVMIGWLRMRQAPDGEDWCGMFSYPRLLQQKEGHIYTPVHPHVEALFDKPASQLDFTQPFRLVVELKEGDLMHLGGLKIQVQHDRLQVDRQQVSIQALKVKNQTVSSSLQGRYHLDIYYDQHVFEIYVNGGKRVLSQIVYNLKADSTIPRPYALWVES